MWRSRDELLESVLYEGMAVLGLLNQQMYVAIDFALFFKVSEYTLIFTPLCAAASKGGVR